MSDKVIEIIFFISGILGVIWLILHGFQTIKGRRQLERDVYLEELEKNAQSVSAEETAEDTKS